jgi:hypothetical protein
VHQTAWLLASDVRVELIPGLFSAICYKFPPKTKSIFPKSYSKEDEQNGK